MSDRALTPVVAVLALLGTVVVLAAVVGAGAVAASDDRVGARGRVVAPVGLSVAVDGDTVTLTHEVGPPLSVHRLRVRVEVDGTPLRYQPPVPFFAARGFRSGPTGPFNAASDGVWSAGERASFTVAGTNAPSIARGRRITVSVYHGSRLLARLTAAVDGSG
jgi:FlaG/FlaF family flagellin (archaellin)